MSRALPKGPTSLALAMDRTEQQAPALRFIFPDFTVILASMREIWPTWAKHECVRDPNQFLNHPGYVVYLGSRFEPVRGIGGNVHAVAH